MLKKAGLIICLATLFLVACNDNNQERTSSGGRKLDENTSYAFGMALGHQITDMDLDVEFNVNALVSGLRETVENKDTRFSLEEAMTMINAFFTEIMEEQTNAMREEEISFLRENGRREGIHTTPSGLQYEVITQGSGERPTATDVVRVHYEGSLVNGTIFDSSRVRGEPAEFPLGAVIAGWTEGIQLMPEGSRYRLYIPSDLGYGSQGAGGIIPPFSTLIFDVELISIVR